MNIREFLAVEVMGWTNWHRDIIPDWRPDELIEQAIMCAEALPHLSCFNISYQPPHNAYVETREDGKKAKWWNTGADGPQPTPAAALSLAVARAAGWKDE